MIKKDLKIDFFAFLKNYIKQKKIDLDDVNYNTFLNNKELSNNKYKEEQSEQLVLEKEAQLLELYKDIPFSQFKKDSIKNLLDISKLELRVICVL